MNFKGRIVIYSIVGCPHCLQAKSLLQDLKLPYVDVSVDRFPPRIRQWLKEKTGKTSVPQIFFNSHYIGGNAELQILVKDKAKLSSLIDQVRTKSHDSDEDPLVPHPSEALDMPSDSKHEFHCEVDDYAILVKELRSSGLISSHKQSLFGKKVPDSFKGRDFVDWAVESKQVSREKALEMGQGLVSRKFGRSAVQEEDQQFKDDDTLYQLLSSAKALNSDVISDCVQRPANDVAEDLRKLILKIFAQYLSPDGRSVDYKGIRDSSMFETYKAMARELQRVDLQDMNHGSKLAFFINIYNALVIHGNIERGTPSNTWQRYKFFSTVAYLIGSHEFTLNEIENGILRANRGSMATLYMTPFGKNDPRLKFALESVEPRIHFALNCGAKSCPPIKTFSADDIEEQLATATESYLETDDALAVEPDKGIIHLSMLFKWYHSDFGADKREIVKWIHSQVGDKGKRESIDELLNKKDFTINYIPYDWGHNNKE